jgi:hypothetical protein
MKAFEIGDRVGMDSFRFAGLREDKDARTVIKEHGGEG